MSTTKKKRKTPSLEFVRVISVEYNIEGGGKKTFEIGSTSGDLSHFAVDHIIKHLQELKTTIKKL